MTSTPLSAEWLDSADCVVLVTDHKAFDYDWLLDHTCVFIDTRNATKHLRNGTTARVVPL